MNDEKLKAIFIQTFNLASEGYDKPALRFFRESANQASEILKLKGDEAILDVATGTGHLALTMAGKYPNTQVVGVDLSDGMLSQAEAKKEKLELGNIHFREMDMTALDFPDDHFDVVLCGFGIFFIENMKQQLVHMSSKTKVDGKVAILTFEDRAFMPLWEVFFNRITSFGVEVPTRASKRVCKKLQCTTLFEEAGLKNVQSEQMDINYYLKNGDEWWDIVWNGGFRGLVNMLSDEDKVKFQKIHIEEINALAANEGILLNVPVLITWAEKQI